MDRLDDLRAVAAATTTTPTTTLQHDGNNNNATAVHDMTSASDNNSNNNKGGDGNDDDDDAHARHLGSALRRASRAIDAFVRAVDDGEVAQAASRDVEAALQTRLDGVHAALDACERKVRAHEARTAALRNNNNNNKRDGAVADGGVVVNETRLRMYDNVAAHANDELLALRQRAWDAQDHWQRLRVARVARQLQLRLTSAPLHPALARRRRDKDDDEDNNNNNVAQPQGDDDSSGGGGGGTDAHDPVDVQLLAESLVHEQRDDDVFGLTPYEMQQAVERYRVLCNIEAKAQQLHRLSTQLNALVHEKGERVEAVAQHAEVLHTRAYAATAQLQRAKHYHSHCGCCCTMM